MRTGCRGGRCGAATPEPRTRPRRSLSWSCGDDGTLIIRGRLTPDAGAVFIHAIGALLPPRKPITPDSTPSPPDLDDHAREQAPGAVADRAEARRADALLSLVTGTDGDGPVVQRGQARVVVHLDATTGTAQIEDGPEIPRSTAERLACDARVEALLSDRRNNRMYAGRARRFATPPR